MKHKKQEIPYALCGLMVLSVTVTVLRGQSIYEGFTDYSDLSGLLSLNGGAGFETPWQGRKALLNSGSALPFNPAMEILPVSLFYIDADGRQLATAGGSLFISGENGNIHLARTLDVTALPNTEPDPQLGKTTYLSFLARRSGPAADPNDPVYNGSYPWGDNLYPRAAGINLFSNDQGDAVPLFIGGVSNATDDVWRLRGQDLDGTNKDPLVNEPFGEGSRIHLVVLRIDHGEGDGGADEINMYLNPRLAAESLNTIGVTADWETRDDPLYLPGNWIGVEAGDASGNRPHAEFTFDEFRIGQTWESVLPLAVTNPCAYPEVSGYMDTGNWMGWVYTDNAPWYYSVRLAAWFYCGDIYASCGEGGAWIYLPN